MNIGVRNAHHKALIQAALWYGIWYYSGTIMASNSPKSSYRPNLKSDNINDVIGNQNTLEYAWTCIICLHRESDTTSALHTLGFENYYARQDNMLFRYGHTNIYTHAKIVLKGNTIVTFYPQIQDGWEVEYQ